MSISAYQPAINAKQDVATFSGFVAIRPIWGILAVLLGFSLIVSTGNALAVSAAQSSQSSQPIPETQFALAVNALVNAPADDAATFEKLEQKALSFLDTVVVSGVPVRAELTLDSLNARLAKYASREAIVGETYRVLRLGGKPPVYALLADFGLDAPSAVRVYTQQGSAGHYALAARIDRTSQQDFLDASLELIPVPSSAVVFVTVAGRTDGLKTGIFTAWQFDDRGLHQLWTSDLIQQSSFQLAADGFQVTYCHDPDDDKPGTCLGMVRERYQWQAGQWKQLESTSVPVPKR